MKGTIYFLQFSADFTFSVTMLIVLCTFVLLGVNITLYKRHIIKAAEIKYLLTWFILELSDDWWMLH